MQGILITKLIILKVIVFYFNVKINLFSTFSYFLRNSWIAVTHNFKTYIFFLTGDQFCLHNFCGLFEKKQMHFAGCD